MTIQEIIEKFISSSNVFLMLASVIWAQFYLSYVCRRHSLIKSEWKNFALTQSSRMYTKEWMAINTKTRKLESGRDAIPYSKALSLGLVPKHIQKGKDFYGNDLCPLFNLRLYRKD